MTSDAQAGNSVTVESDYRALNFMVEGKITEFLERLKEEFHFSRSELLVITKFVWSYVQENRDQGTAQVLSGILHDSGFLFTETTPDPLPAHEKKAKESALKLISELRNLDMNTDDINAITVEMKNLGSSARYLGTAHGLDMISRKR